MFPKPTSKHRGNAGILSGTLGVVSEKQDGTLHVPNNTTVTTPDDEDVQEWEVDTGAGWTPVANLAAVLATPFAASANVRTRITNAYFQSSGSYITSGASPYTDTGGLSAFSSACSAAALSEGLVIAATYNGDTQAFDWSIGPRPSVFLGTFLDSQLLVGVSYTYATGSGTETGVYGVSVTSGSIPVPGGVIDPVIYGMDVTYQITYQDATLQTYYSKTRLY